MDIFIGLTRHLDQLGQSKICGPYPMNQVSGLETKLNRDSIRTFVSRKTFKGLKREKVMGFGPNDRPNLPKQDQPLFLENAILSFLAFQGTMMHA